MIDKNQIASLIDAIEEQTKVIQKMATLRTEVEGSVALSQHSVEALAKEVKKLDTSDADKEAILNSVKEHFAAVSEINTSEGKATGDLLNKSLVDVNQTALNIDKNLNKLQQNVVKEVINQIQRVTLKTVLVDERGKKYVASGTAGGGSTTVIPVLKNNNQQVNIPVLSSVAFAGWWKLAFKVINGNANVTMGGVTSQYLQGESFSIEAETYATNPITIATDATATVRVVTLS